MSKRELEQRLLCLEEENKKLKEENAYLKFELQELRSKQYKTGKKPPPGKPEAPIPKKKGGLLGHIGWFRKKPERIDRIEEVRMNSCPECGSKEMTECDKVSEHIQEDIVLPN